MRRGRVILFARVYRSVRILLIPLLILFLIQCDEQSFIETSELDKENNQDFIQSDIKIGEIPESILLLGEKLENPYKTQNMDKALKSLKSKGKRTPLDEIETNYLYVRFLPKTNEEYNAINGDSTIDTYEYPLDYEIAKAGNKYQDKDLKNEKFSWIYCAIPIEKTFDKNIKMEILEELFLPFGNGKEAPSDLENTYPTFLTDLEEESFDLTGNLTNSGENKREVNSWYA